MTDRSDMPFPAPNREETLCALFAERRSPDFKDWEGGLRGDWYKDYRQFCERVAQAQQIDDTLFETLIWPNYNGISLAGRCLMARTLFDTLAASRQFREAVSAFKSTPAQTHYNQVLALADSFAEAAGKTRIHLRINRMAVAFNTELSPMPDEAALRKTLRWFEKWSLLDFKPTGNWFADNRQLTRSVAKAISGESDCDVWICNIFLWWLYDVYAMPDEPPPAVAAAPEKQVFAWRALFAEMRLPKFRKWLDGWKEEYKQFCEQATTAPEIDDNLFRGLLWEKWNGISVVGQSLLSHAMYDKLVASKKYREVLANFRVTPDAEHFAHLLALTDELAAQMGHRKFHLRVNRIAATFNTEISSLPNEDIFVQTLQWLGDFGMLDFKPAGDWFADNLHLTQAITNAIASEPGYDIWYRNMFLWWIYEIHVAKQQPLPEATDMNQEPQQAPTPPIPVVRRSLNSILYGPPGTGKTHDVVNHVLKIIDGKPIPVEQTAEEYATAKERFDELKAQGRVGFVTFHQSYGYEDFIEGIRPVLDDNTGDSVSYELHDGVFKAFCKRALAETTVTPPAAVPQGGQEELLDVLRKANDVVWKVSLGGSLREGRPDLKYNQRIHDECFEDGNIRIGWDQYGPMPNDGTDYFMGGKSVLDSFIRKAAVGDIVISLCTSLEIDGIGVIEGDYEWTGPTAERAEPRYKYYNRIRRVRWIVRNARLFIREINDRKDLSQVTFYRTGISKASILSLAETTLAGPSASVQKTESEAAGEQPYVFVIDEINRGNISKIFGELITLVEAGKRLGAKEETRVVLPYSGEEFGVPPNVFILGTMNTADRSIALLDTALRRRFDFVEMMPRPELLGGLKVVDGKGKDTGINLEKMLASMNGRIEFLLDREHMIGHAYFLGGGAEEGAVSMAEMADIFRFKIVPLLQEYFFEDYAKIRLVLGDASCKRKVPGFQFVTEEKGLAKTLFPGVPEDFSGPVNGDRALYRINGAAFDRVEAYRGIYGPVAGGGGGAADGPEEGE